VTKNAEAYICDIPVVFRFVGYLSKERTFKMFPSTTDGLCVTLSKAVGSEISPDLEACSKDFSNDLNFKSNFGNDYIIDKQSSEINEALSSSLTVFEKSHQWKTIKEQEESSHEKKTNITNKSLEPSLKRFCSAKIPSDVDFSPKRLDFDDGAAKKADSTYWSAMKKSYERENQMKNEMLKKENIELCIERNSLVSEARHLESLLARAFAHLQTLDKTLGEAHATLAVNPFEGLRAH